MTKVLIDTCMWATYFDRPQSAVTRAIDDLVDENRVVLIGPVLTEVLLGIKNPHRADYVASQLEGVQWEVVRWQDWKYAAQLGRQLAARGEKIPLTDLAISAIAIDRDFEVYSSDPHFDLFSAVKRFRAD